MNTLALITQSSALSLGMIPSSTQSATALPTAVWAGPKILLASSKSPTVTLGIMIVAGLVIKLGLITLSNGVCPTDNWLNPLAKAFPTGPSFHQ